MTQPPETPRDDALPPPPPAWSGHDTPPPPPDAWSAPDAPAPPAWAPPAPLSFGPPEPPAGPLVSPSVAAYQPPPPSSPSYEPVTGPLELPPPPPPPASYPPPAPLTYYPTSDSASASGAGGLAPPPPPPAYPPPSAYPPPTPGYYPPAGYGGYAPGYPGALPMPYGFDPMTGMQYSEKSRTTAGLLQLLLSLLLTLGGIGRLYAGHGGIGVTQLVLSVGSWIVICAGGGSGILFGLLMLTGVWFWSWIDGVVILSGRPVDGQGRPLRP